MSEEKEEDPFADELRGILDSFSDDEPESGAERYADPATEVRYSKKRSNVALQNPKSTRNAVQTPEKAHESTDAKDLSEFHTGDKLLHLPAGGDWPWYEDEAGVYHRIYPITQVPVLTAMPTPAAFFKQYVQTNTPVLLKGGCKHMPATHKWTDEYLKEQSGHTPVRVEKSGTGNYGHAAVQWSMGEEPLANFIDDYVQEESSKYLSTLLPSALAEDVYIPSVYPGSDAMIAEVLLWHGKGESNSLIHNDQFDNLYMIMSGRKHLTLFDPLEGPHVHEQIRTHTSPVNISNPNLNKHPLFKKTRSIQITVEAGDILYIPTLWFHEVITEGRSSAITTWFDGMNFRAAVGTNSGGEQTSPELLKKVWERAAKVGQKDAAFRAATAVTSTKPRPMSSLHGCAKPIDGMCYFGVRED